ncbi:hypothetical protein [Natrarchaeobaculum aegyptiacum]|uniref:DUF8164 domain-containing protein n=1 Tax=Natrarchaeobaculum aegyptiacum TaxID=745377 RepID=A0A2Z2HZK2_9EURY|nr:hypothetical protein [Natrarchaeobaculum aegyptiacum]ARS89168.1 hypothetical protein B1756_04965 [Natrarchaeobaculum aegyptiacum]
MSGGSPAAESTPDGYPVGPLLERARGSADGPIEVGVSMSGTEPIDENELDVFLVQSAVDPGERIELGIFVSGVGDLDATDLSVFYDDEAILDLEDPGVVRRSAVVDTATSPDAVDEDTDRPPERSASDSTTVRPTEHVQSTSFQPPGSRRRERLRRAPLEGNVDTDPAYILELNTDASAPTGEFSLPVAFTYRSESGIRQVTKIPTVRIRSLRERVTPWLVRLGAFGVALGGIVAFAQWTGLGL